MNKDRRYKEVGKCIWCGATEGNTSFETAPHILPRRLGGTEIDLMFVIIVIITLEQLPKEKLVFQA